MYLHIHVYSGIVSPQAPLRTNIVQQLDALVNLLSDVVTVMTLNILTLHKIGQMLEQTLERLLVSLDVTDSTSHMRLPTSDHTRKLKRRA